MTNDIDRIIEAIEDVGFFAKETNGIKRQEYGRGWNDAVKAITKKLQDYLKPSRKEIADYLKDIEHNKMILDSVLFGQLASGKEGLSLHSCNESKKWLNYAIDELRKDA